MVVTTTAAKVGMRNRVLVTVIAGGVFASVASLPMLLLASQAMVRGFGISYTALQWRNLLFWTAFGVTLPFFGRVTERVRPRTQFVGGIAVFVVSAVLGALVSSWALYLVSPALQGMADAIVVGAQAVLIRELLPAERVGWAFGWQGAVLAAAQLGSPALGGFLLEHVSWRMIYWIVAGVGVLMGIAALALLPGRPGHRGSAGEAGEEARPSSLPVSGTFMLALAVASWQAIILVSGGLRVVAAGVATVSTAAFVICESRRSAQNRYFPSGLLKNRVFFFASLRGLLVYFPLNAIAMFLPLCLIAVDGWSTGRAGVVLLIDALVVTVFGSTAGSFADKNPVRVVRIGFASLTASGVILALSSGSIAGVCVALLLLGLGVALVVPGQSKIAMDAVSERETGSYMSVFQSAQFGSIGLATVVFAPLLQGGQAQTLSGPGFEILCLICTVLFAAGVLSVSLRGHQGTVPVAAETVSDLSGRR